MANTSAKVVECVTVSFLTFLSFVGFLCVYIYMLSWASVYTVVCDKIARIVWWKKSPGYFLIFGGPGNFLKHLQYLQPLRASTVLWEALERKNTKKYVQCLWDTTTAPLWKNAFGTFFDYALVRFGGHVGDISGGCGRLFLKQSLLLGVPALS